MISDAIVISSTNTCLVRRAVVAHELDDLSASRSAAKGEATHKRNMTSSTRGAFCPTHSVSPIEPQPPITANADGHLLVRMVPLILPHESPA